MACSTSSISDSLNRLSLGSPKIEPVVIENITQLKSFEVALKSSSLLALDCEGVNLGRDGELSLIQVSSLDTCFLFDMLGMDGSSEILSFLKTILEDADVTKIIHDCKMDADALLHICGITLAGVHDTQAWDNVLHGSQDNLNRTLDRYKLQPCAARDSSVYDKNFRFWAQRPLTDKMIQWAAGDVSCLFELYQAQKDLVVDPSTLQKCHDASTRNSRFLMGMSIQKVSIHSTQIGNFIGKGGRNLFRLQGGRGSDGKYFYRTMGGRRSGIVGVYAPPACIDDAVKKLKPYMRHYYDY